VIESKEFYKLFAILKRRLDQQKISHPTAGEFLHTIKTLMAKIKVLSLFLLLILLFLASICRQMIGERFLVCHSLVLLNLRFILTTGTMAEHRCKSLGALLTIALATGFSEIEPQLEPLKVPWLIDSRHEFQSLTRFSGL
jgi:hypothetical protein